MEVGPGGLDLTPFARQIYKHPDVEVHFVQTNVKLAQRQLPLRLAAAGFPRTPIEDGTCPRISEMQLVAVPPEMRRSTFVLPSGQVLFPFEDSPHIAHDGVLLHGRSALQRAIVYRILQQSECLSPNGWAVARGQARPPEPGEVVASFPFSLPCQLYLSPHLVQHHQSRPGCCHKVAPPPSMSRQLEHMEVQTCHKPTQRAPLPS